MSDERFADVTLDDAKERLRVVDDFLLGLFAAGVLGYLDDDSGDVSTLFALLYVRQGNPDNWTAEGITKANEDSAAKSCCLLSTPTEVGA